MAVNTAVKGILCCPLCLDVMRDPKTLHCNHSYCKRCLADFVKCNYLKKDGSLQAPGMMRFIVCPTCNTKSQGFRTLTEVTTNHIINTLLEAQRKDTGEGTNAISSCVCGKPAKAYCYRCSDSYCPECCKNKTGKKCAIQDGDVTEFLQCNIKHEFIKAPLQDDWECIDHSIPLNLFCMYCKKVICIDCFLENHTGHLTKLVKYAREEALILVETIETLQSITLTEHIDLHQTASAESHRAMHERQRVCKQLKKDERKIHGLISALFKSYRLHCKSIAKQKKRTADEVLEFCENSMMKLARHDFKTKTDMELAFMVKDFDIAKKKAEAMANTVRAGMQKLKLPTFQKSTELSVNEEAIFSSILSIFDHFQLGQYSLSEFAPRDYTFENYVKGEYAECGENRHTDDVSEDDDGDDDDDDAGDDDDDAGDDDDDAGDDDDDGDDDDNDSDYYHDIIV